VLLERMAYMLCCGYVEMGMYMAVRYLIGTYLWYWLDKIVNVKLTFLVYSFYNIAILAVTIMHQIRR
jgi:hypothetical protein